MRSLRKRAKGALPPQSQSLPLNLVHLFRTSQFGKMSSQLVSGCTKGGNSCGHETKQDGSAAMAVN